jgi:EAL domain-containing protein (putative c-di-GMP-specific phosphodiesterase class I)/GGDEF domain-containing protein
MTLTRQLWIVITVLISLTFISGFLVSGYSARNYFVEQLTVKNIDNATGLALSLSQMEKDPVTVELMISAQFDTGHYHRIRLEGPNGETLQIREREEQTVEAPQWFASLIDFDIPPGVAQIQDGWRQYGTLYVESESAYALAALWRITYQLFFWFLAIALVCGLIATAVLRRISQPLQAVVAQAEAIGERRFVTSEEPGTLEFKRVVRAMNTLTKRVRSMLEYEAKRLDEIRRQSQLDPATGVANREQFFRLLSARLNLDDRSICDALVLLRITGLQALNSKLGRAGTDRWIKQLVDDVQAELSSHSDNYSQCVVGRLNGSDFVVLAQDSEFADELTERIWAVVSRDIDQQKLGEVYPVALAGSAYHPGETHGHLMARLDDLLAAAEQASGRRLMMAQDASHEPLFSDAESWRHALLSALQSDSISFACYPAMTARGGIVHEEAMLRMRMGERELPAGAVIGWARRLRLLPRIDLQMLDRVLDALDQEPSRQLAVNLSVDSVRDVASHLAIIEKIAEHDKLVTRRLSLELNEQVAVQYPESLASFAAAVKRHGVRVGLQSAGKNIAAIGGLETLGLDYMKVDASLIQHQDEQVASLLRGLCKLGHSLGLIMIAEGVLADTDQAALTELGFDAFTGPGVSAG